VKAKFVYESLNEVFLLNPSHEYNAIYDDENKKIGSFTVVLKGDVPIDPKNHFSAKELKKQGFDKDYVFHNSAYLSGGFIIDPEYRKMGYGQKAIKKYFIDNPNIENIFLYAISWQGAVPFWHKIGGKSILVEKHEGEDWLHYIQLNRNDILK
jgi:GNAT superfamily N-acetyltransferase